MPGTKKLNKKRKNISLTGNLKKLLKGNRKQIIRMSKKNRLSSRKKIGGDPLAPSPIPDALPSKPPSYEANREAVNIAVDANFVQSTPTCRNSVDTLVERFKYSSFF